MSSAEILWRLLGDDNHIQNLLIALKFDRWLSSIAAEPQKCQISMQYIFYLQSFDLNKILQDFPLFSDQRPIIHMYMHDPVTQD